MVTTRRVSPFILLLPCCLVLLAGCPPEEKVTVPQSDPTPPTVALDISGFSQLISLTSTSSPEERRGGASQIGLIAAGTDDDAGVRRVAIIHSYKKSCVDSSDVATTQQTLGSPVEKIQAGQAGSHVAKKLTVQHSIAVSDFNRCASGTQLSSLEIVAYAEAENFSGGKARTATFTFRLVRP